MTKAARPLKMVRSFAWIVIRLSASLLLIGFAATCLARMAPGFGTEERELDPRFAASKGEQWGEPDRNVAAIYWRFLCNAARGELGHSRYLNRPVRELLEQRFPVSLKIVSFGLAAGWMAALLAASAGAIFSRQAASFAGMALSGLTLSIPSALLAYLCFLLRAPAFLLVALVVFARIFRMIDSLFQSALQSTFAAAARAHGVSSLRILGSHVLAATWREMAALAGASVSIAIGAAIPAEAFCDQPGIGQLAWKAALSRDLPVLISLTLLIGAVTIFCNRSADAIVHARRVAA